MTTPKATPQKRTPLEQLRLDRDWTYPELAERIHAVTGIHRSEPAVRRAAQGRPHRPALANAIKKFLKAERRPRGSEAAPAEEART